MRTFFIVTLAASFMLGSVPGEAQTRYTVKGKLTHGVTRQPIDFALVIVPEAGVVANAVNGTYAFEVKKAGKYNVKIQAQGFQPVNTSITIERSVSQDFVLYPVSSKSGVVIRGDRDIQTISRQTMTARQIKEVPASFGDSITALSSLPGVNRPMGFFGPLVIRGADDATNGYFVDDIPLYKSMHFGGIHSVINNDFMREIDLYSSAFPAQFSRAQSAVININTIDDVKEFGGNADVGLISANALIKVPITRTVYEDGKAKEENTGYMVASGRYGYLSLFIPFIYENVFHKDLNWLPQYWDYQFKAKYNINEHHSIAFLAFGNKDYIDLVIKDSYLQEGDDPALSGFQVYNNDQAHSQGIYYTYRMNDRFTNTLIAYSALNQSYQWYNLPKSTASWAHDLGIRSNPYIFGLKDKVKLEWWESHGELRLGAEANYYLFKTGGKTIRQISDVVDFNDESTFVVENLGQTIENKTMTGYVENKITYGGLTFVPGVHSEYLARTKTTTIDPRGMISYKLPTDTTIGLAGGSYSYFVQTSSYYFAELPDLAETDLKPQRSIHRSASIEQKIRDYTFKIEGFYNNFWDLAVSDSYIGSDGKEYGTYRSCGKLKTYGLELLAKISDEKDQGLFGWMSYTFNRSRYISNQSASFSDYGNCWINSYYDMPHVFKVVSGYTFGSNTISAKFQYYSSAPYTKIIDGKQDTTWIGSTERWVPVYGKPNTGRLPAQYSLDVRYTHKTSYRWGYVSWYVEAIGAISSASKEYYWDYRYDYSSSNPRIKTVSGSLSIIPNFGVETKF